METTAFTIIIVLRMRRSSGAAVATDNSGSTLPKTGVLSLTGQDFSVRLAVPDGGLLYTVGAEQHARSSILHSRGTSCDSSLPTQLLSVQ